MSNVINKISTKSIKCDLSMATETPLDLYLVYGVVNAFEKVETSYGDSDRLLGQFEAVNKETGEIFISGQLFLPRGLSKLITGKMSKASPSVQFAYSVGSKPVIAKDGEPSYEYTFTEEVEPDAADSLSKLRAAARKTLK